MYWFWRIFYSLLETDIAVSMTSFFLLASGSLVGPSGPQRLLARLEQWFVNSGFPGHPQTWLNLNLSRFAWRIKRKWQEKPALPKKELSLFKSRRLKVGIFGGFSGLLSFPSE